MAPKAIASASSANPAALIVTGNNLTTTVPEIVPTFKDFLGVGTAANPLISLETHTQYVGICVILSLARLPVPPLPHRCFYSSGCGDAVPSGF